MDHPKKETVGAVPLADHRVPAEHQGGRPLLRARHFAGGEWHDRDAGSYGGDQYDDVVGEVEGSKEHYNLLYELRGKRRVYLGAKCAHLQA